MPENLAERSARRKSLRNAGHIRVNGINVNLAIRECDLVGWINLI
jgi:hypothetical protein